MRSFCAAALVLVCSVSRLHAQAAANDPAARALSQRVTLSASNELLTDVLTRLRRDVPLAWSGDIIPDGLRVSLSVRDTPLRNTLEALLAGNGLGYVVTRLGTVVIIPQRAASAAPTTAPAETHEVARGLAGTGVRQLDAVVVMGSPVTRNPEREQPTAVGVVNAARIATIPNATVADIMRTMLPGVILWDRGPAGPPAPIAAVRGVSSFTTRALKTYVDGIELASPELFTLVDTRSIERIELIRGPQGAALYGPDALNGILQIETRHGRAGKTGVGVRGSATAGRFERSDLAAAELSQDYSAGLTAGAQSSAFDAGGAFTRVGDAANTPLTRTWSLNGGARALAGNVIVDASARIGQRQYATDSTAGTPNARVTRDLEERGVALTAVHTVSDHWRQTLVAGYHRVSGVREPFRSPLLTPTLPLGATDETASRTSLRYSGVADFANAFTLSGGAELSRRQVERSARSAANPANLLSLSRNDLHSAGGFVQGRWRVASRLVLSGGTRAEHLSTVAPGVGLLWASTAGASWSQELRVATVRFRAAWGNGIRAPEPGMNDALSRGNIEQRANANLVPERQRGLEAGADIFFAKAAFIKLTWYDQRALDLIQQVRVRTTDTTKLTYQFQNVGVVRNRGIELEGSYEWRRFTATAVAYFPRSTVQHVSPGYGGELRTGDRLLEVPDAAGSASIRYDARTVHIEVGASWIGAWTGYDIALIERIAGGLAPPRGAEREYWLEYPGVTRPFVTVSLDLPRDYRAFVRVDNPANNAGLVRDNRSPPLGRTMMLGVALRQ